MNHNATTQINPFVIVTALIAAFGGFTLGFDAGFAIDGKDQVSLLFNLSNFQWSIIACISILGAFIAIVLSGKVIDKFGSKHLLQFTAIGFIIGLVLTASAYNLPQLIVGRLLVGICIGIASYASPLYISEISPSSIRGGMILLNGIAITLGQTIAFLIGYLIHDLNSASWRILLIIEIVPALVLFIGMINMPQSPRWIAKQRGVDSARDILTQLRPQASSVVELELNEIKNSLNNKTFKSSLQELFSKKILPVLIVGISLGIFQQFVGISAIMYYGPVVFQAIGLYTITDGIFATFCISAINVVLTIISAFLIDYLGRRFLLLLGTFITAISLFLVGFVCQGKFSVAWGICFIVMYIIGYCISLGSLFWVLIAEIFPTNIRGRAMSFTTAIQCFANFVVTITFLEMFNYLGQASTFILYGMMSCGAFIFIFYLVPETKGVTLEVIENNLNLGKKTRELGESSNF